MEYSKLNEVDSVITPPTPMGMTVNTGSLVDQISLLVADWHNRILGVNLVVAMTTILASDGGGLGQVSIPHGIAVDPNTRNIFVADTGNHRIQKFTPNFVPIKAWGSQGTGDSQFSLATGIAVDSNGDIYVTDTNNHRVQKFDNNGVFIKAWGKKGTGDGEFILPFYIALESDNDIVVTDRDNQRIQKFNSDGQFLRSWGKPGSGDGEFKNPLGIAVDSNDDNYVIDWGNHRVQKFDVRGNFIKSWGSLGSGDGQFNQPVGITFNSLTGNLFVGDFGNKNIQIFTKDGVFLGKVIFGIISDQ